MRNNRLTPEQVFQLEKAEEMIEAFYGPLSIEQVCDSQGHGFDFVYLRNQESHEGKIRIGK